VLPNRFQSYGRAVGQVQRRIFGLVAAGLTAGLLASACGPTGSGTVTLKFVAADYGTGPATSSKKYWDDLAARFTARNPHIKVDVRVYSWNSIDDQVAAMIRRGDVPDVLQTGSYADFASKGMLYSADDLLSVPVQSDIIPSLADAGRVDRTEYGIPFVSSSRLFFYNTGLFAKAGITGGPPTNWAELKADAIKLKAAGVKVPFGLPLGPEEAQGEALLWILGGGGNYTDETGGYTINSDTNVRTFEWIKDNLVDPGLTGGDPATMNRQDVFDEFLKGRVGMLNGHPTLTGAAAKAGITYGLAPIPGRTGPLDETLGVADWMMGFRKNGHRDQIGTFLAYVYQEKNALRFLREYDLLPVTTTASDAMSKDRSLKPVWPFLKKLPTARFYPLGDPAWAPVSAELKHRIGAAASRHPRAVLNGLQSYADHQVTHYATQTPPAEKG
jgi:multiple sugar transport system substrate-binding protein